MIMYQMDRYLLKEIQYTINKKLILISGPRQVGKTTLAKTIGSSLEYLNYDRLSDRKKILKEEWDREKDFLILDEIHKMKKWKLWLKGIYDTEENKKIIVTGTAKLDTLKKVGDSMAGRYFQYQLFPLDLKELRVNNFRTSKENLDQLLSISGFPEPFFSDSMSFYKKWRRSHLDVIIKQDIIGLDLIKRISDLEILIDLLAERAGTLISYNSLREDLNTDDKTVKRWLVALENSYLIFKISPYSKKLKNAIKLISKYYFYDLPRVANEGARLENLVALSLLKETSYRNEVEGEDFALHYLRNKNQQEVDFLVCKNKIPHLMIEVKNSDDSPSKNFLYFEQELLKQNPKIMKVQLVKNLKKEFSTKNGIKICNLENWLEKMDF